MRHSVSALLVLAACDATPEAPTDPVLRELIHRSRPGDTLDGPETLARAAGLTPVAGQADWRIGDAQRDAPMANVVQVWTDGSRTLWRHDAPAAAREVAVVGLPAEAAPGGAHLLGFIQHGPAHVGGELVGELFVQLPERIPGDVCVRVSGATPEQQPLAHARVPLTPGATGRPILRHRLRLTALPDQVLAAVLIDCSTAERLPDTESLQLPRPERVSPPQLPDVAALRAQSGVADPEAVLVTDRAGTPALVRDEAGYSYMAPPPLPRIQRGDAWAVVVAGPTDLSSLAADSKPLAPATGLFADADLALLSLDTPLALGGEWTWPRPLAPADPAPLRRGAPEHLDGIAEAGVDALLPGHRIQDAGDEAAQETALHAAAAGTPVIEGLRVFSLPHHGPRVAVVAHPTAAWSATDASEITARIAQARTVADTVLVGVTTPRPLPESALEAILTAAPDAIWVAGPEAPGVLDIRGGVPVMTGLPPSLTGSRQRSLAIRWYVAPGEVIRADLVVLTEASGTLDRERSADEAQPLLEPVASASRLLGTDLRVGETIAAVDIRAHWRRPPAQPGRETWQAPVLPPPPEAALPDRCRSPLPTKEGIALGEHLALHLGAVRAEPPPGPIRVDLTWVPDAPLAAGRLEVAGTGSNTPWRRTHRPCEGAWSFEQWEPGVAVRDTIWLWPPADAIQTPKELSGVLKIAGKVVRPSSGERRFSLGNIP